MRYISLPVTACFLLLPVALWPSVRPQSPSPIRIVLVGDSTVTDEAGWGAGFRQLVTDNVEVINQAASGRSSKSYIDEGRWTEALSKRGQYYLIQFGHNDEPGKGPERETDPKTTFRSYLSRYVDEARAAGAKPILVTSLVRRIYNEDGSIATTQTPYVEAVRALAKAKKVPLVDLHAISKEDAEQTGHDVWADLSPRDDKGEVDRTHLNSKGSAVVARFVVDALREVVPELRAYVLGPAKAGHYEPDATRVLGPAKAGHYEPDATRVPTTRPAAACTAAMPAKRCSRR